MAASAHIAPNAWIFAYGSLIWRADFPFEAREPGFISDFGRRFWQGSTDHRGVPEAPGRVVTLVDAPGESCWGVAYCISAAQAPIVMAQLDFREKGGYQRRAVPVMLASGIEVEGLVYHATKENPNYLGPARPAEIASQISTARGPSGTNREYLFNLESALNAIRQPDDHVSEIANALRSLEQDR